MRLHLLLGVVAPERHAAVLPAAVERPPVTVELTERVPTTVPELRVVIHDIPRLQLHLLRTTYIDHNTPPKGVN